MSYIKNIWVDQDVARPKTYQVTENQDGSITLTDDFGLVTELGTPVDEAHMNHIEEGIEGVDVKVGELADLETTNKTSIVNAVNSLLEVDTDRLHALKGYEDAGELLTDAEGLADVTYYAHSTFDLSKFTVVGSPSITDDGIASGFTSGDYLKTSTISKTASQTFEIAFEFTSSTWPTQDLIAFDGSFYAYCDGGSSIYFVYGGRSPGQTCALRDIRANSVYKCKWGWNGTSHYLEYSINGVEQETIISNLSTGYAYNGTCNIGYGIAGSAFLGSMNLKQFSITVDGVPVFSGNKTGIDTIKPNDYTVVGTPTISADGVASGFDTSNYLTADVFIDFTKTWKCQGEFTTGDTISAQNIVSLDGQISPTYYLVITGAGHLSFRFNNGSTINTNFTLLSNKTYSYEVGWDKTKLYLRIGLKGSSLTEFKLDTTTGFVLSSSSSILIGTTSSFPFLGFIDLNSFKIYVDGNLVYQPCLKIPYTESKTGSKIVDSAYRDRVSDMYEQFGYASYYTLDEGTSFTIPQGEIYGLIGKEKQNSIDYIMPDWANAIQVSASPYTAPSKGYIIGQTFVILSSQTAGLIVNGLDISEWQNASNISGGIRCSDKMVIVDKGDVITINNMTVYFVPMKGVN